MGLYTCLPYRASICYEFQNTFKQKETGENEVEVCQNVLVEINRLIMLERAEYDGPGLELERSVDWSGATKRSVDWSGTPEGGGRDRESQGYVSSSCYM